MASTSLSCASADELVPCQTVLIHSKTALKNTAIDRKPPVAHLLKFGKSEFDMLTSSGCHL